MQNELFGSDTKVETPAIDPNANYADQLIGEGKKYKDVEAAAKANVYKDAHIQRLEQETAAMRSQLKGEQKLDDFLDKLAKSQPAPGQTSTPDTTPAESQPNAQNQKAALTAADVVELFETREQKKLEEANLNAVVLKVKEIYGANYKTVLSQKAEELGASQEDLMVLAKTQPAAFLKLVDATGSAPDVGNAAPQSSVNTRGLGKTVTGERDYAYYQNLRKQIGDRAYMRSDIQKQVHDDATRLGDAFFSQKK